jgi:23S rRNA (uracil1939-C5)-methyltransferase
MSRKRKKPPEGTFQATIHALSHDGKGIASVEGKTTFIPNSLPGETVEFNYTRCKSSFDEGRVTQILQASPDRATPLCPHTDVCGACSLQHIQHDAQIQLKQDTLLNQLKHFGQTAPKTILAPITGPTHYYRLKARLGARHVEKKGLPLVGFREKNGRYLAVMDSCAILHASVGKKIMALRTLLSTLSCPNQIPQIEIAIGEDTTVLIIRHLVPLTPDDLDLLAAFSQKEDLCLYLQPGNKETIQTLEGSQDLPLLHYTLPDHGLTLYFHPIDFIQVNLDINRKMVNHALALLELSPSDNVLDLFCGLGNFTLAIAKQCHHVTGIEGTQTMVDRAYYNAKMNNITNADFYTYDLNESFSNEAWGKQPFNKILIDPPRSGAEAALPQIVALNPERIVYVSCNPATLARDAGILVNQFGYQLEKTGVMDMFPHTTHVESIALFTRKQKK